MERRVLLAVLLSFVVLYGYQLLFPPPPEPKPTATGQQTTASPAPEAPQPAQPPQAEAAPSQVPSSTQAVAGRDIVVEGAAVRAVFTTRGAVLKSWQLKKYRDETGKPLELVATHAPAGTPLPFTLATTEPEVSNTLASSGFTANVDALTIDSGTKTLQFSLKDASGIEAQKTFTFSADRPYSIGVTAEVKRAGQELLPVTVSWGPAIGSGIVHKSRTYNPAAQPVFYRDGKVTRLSADKIAAQPAQDGTFGFAGVDDHYFLSALVTPKQQPLRVAYQPLAVPVPDVPEGAHYVSWSARFPSPLKDETFFFGPKDFDVLVAVNRDLVRAIDFGMFAWLVVPLLRALKWINGYVGNYGWSLIILTVLINLAMFPLRHKSVVSMRKMQEVQPEVKAIQDRYSKLKMSDPARSKMNVELMNLYRERGVNPASGCVPMLLTLPVLFAFYAMLSVAIELRGAPFIGWIHDLSAHDPLFITPILMGVTMMIQQKMTPTTADPVQQKMMLVMPIVMTTMFLWAASGLVIYWTVSNIWGIGQQMITNRLIGPAPQRTPPRPPAERRVKNVGGGRTAQAKGNQ
jgi:YidC/Oxa1 family membrane protein insertase